MPAGPRQVALRAYRTAVLPLSRKYGVPVLPADPKLSEIGDFHRRLLKKVHPDKGGTPEDFRVARSAKALLDEARSRSSPPSASSVCPASQKPQASFSGAATCAKEAVVGAWARRCFGSAPHFQCFGGRFRRPVSVLCGDQGRTCAELPHSKQWGASGLRRVAVGRSGHVDRV